MLKSHYKNIAIAAGQSITYVNKIDILENGDQIFHNLLDTINKAQSYIFFETFVFWNGEIAQKLSRALMNKAAQGVKCYIIFDGFGCKDLDKKLIREMRESGINISYYNPISFNRFFKFKNLNRRTHRKILIADGDVGHIGGVGIADQWRGDANNPNEWRDLHYRLEGPILDQLQSAFFDNWLEYPVEEINLELLKMSHSDQSGTYANIVLSTPTAKYNALRFQLLEAFKIAKSSIKIMTPYFIPDDEEINVLIECARRGVRVEVIIPGPYIDKKVTKFCSRYNWGKCLENNIKIYEYQKTFNHSKLIIIDHFWTTVGSLNFDTRSLKLNEEANLNVYDEGFASCSDLIFEKDKKSSCEVNLEDWRNRPIFVKFLDFMASHLRRFL